MGARSADPSGKRAAVAFTVLVALSAAGSAHACPRCETAVEARQAVWEDQPGRWLLVAVAPFAAMLALGAATYRIGRPGRPRGRDNLPEETGAP